MTGQRTKGQIVPAGKALSKGCCRNCTTLGLAPGRYNSLPCFLDMIIVIIYCFYGGSNQEPSSWTKSPSCQIVFALVCEGKWGGKGSNLLGLCQQQIRTALYWPVNRGSGVKALPSFHPPSVEGVGRYEAFIVLYKQYLHRHGHSFLRSIQHIICFFPFTSKELWEPAQEITNERVCYKPISTHYDL